MKKKNLWAGAEVLRIILLIHLLLLVTGPAEPFSELSVPWLHRTDNRAPYL